MATNHTTNYNLNLWEPQDDFLRSEFNENTQKIDAMFGPDNLPWVTGTYTGNAAEAGTQHITLGFRPTFLFIIATGRRYGFGVTHNGTSIALCTYSFSTSCGASPVSDSLLSLTDDGFTVKRDYKDFEYTLNNNGTKYLYFAIR